MNSAAGVTSVITRRVRPDHHEAYEARLRRLLRDAGSTAGYLGADIVPPQPGADEYTSIVRFDSVDALRAFQRSELSNSFQRDVVPHVRGAAVWDHHTGLEFWFDPPPGTVVPQPVRWRMALVLGVVVYLLVLIFGVAASGVIGGWPAPLRLAVVIAAEITLMTYVILPRVTAALSGWIYPTRATA